MNYIKKIKDSYKENKRLVQFKSLLFRKNIKTDIKINTKVDTTYMKSEHYFAHI